jgi:hypothetical protein
MPINRWDHELKKASPYVISEVIKHEEALHINGRHSIIMTHVGAVNNKSC